MRVRVCVSAGGLPPPLPLPHPADRLTSSDASVQQTLHLHLTSQDRLHPLCLHPPRQDLLLHLQQPPQRKRALTADSSCHLKWANRSKTIWTLTCDLCPPDSASMRSTTWSAPGSPPPGSEVYLWRRSRQPKGFAPIAILPCCAACRMLPMTEAPPTKLAYTVHDCCCTWTDLGNFPMDTRVCRCNVGNSN